MRKFFETATFCTYFTHKQVDDIGALIPLFMFFFWSISVTHPVHTIKTSSSDVSALKVVSFGHFLKT